MNFGKRFKACKPNVLLVHGEDSALEALQGALRDEGLKKVTIQEEGEPVDV